MSDETEYYKIPEGLPPLSSAKLRIETTDTGKVLRGLFRAEPHPIDKTLWRVRIVIPDLDTAEGYREREIVIGPEYFGLMKRRDRELLLRCAEDSLGDTPVPRQLPSPA